jgi:cytochrome c553
MPSWTRDNRKRPDNPRRALVSGARWIGSTILLGSLMLCPAVVPAQPTERAPDTMEARLLACAACHGRQGEGTKNDYFPSGQQAGRLSDESAGRVPRRASSLPADELSPRIYSRLVSPKDADYFAALRPPPLRQAVADASPALLGRGRSLVSEGDSAHRVPPCSGCHGPNLTGMEPAIPGLTGLHASYISAQLGAWRYGTRTAATPDCMQFVAASLSESDVTAVAAWLASLPRRTRCWRARAHIRAAKSS